MRVMIPIKIVKFLNGNCEDKKIKLPEQLDAKSQGTDICRSNGPVFVAFEGSQWGFQCGGAPFVDLILASALRNWSKT